MRWLALLVCTAALAQEIDTVIFEGEQMPHRLYDQISDLSERNALESLFTTKDRNERSRRAGEFLRQYPQSAFLSVVYEVGARSAADLADALRLGRASLRLLPENNELQAAVAELEGRPWVAKPELDRKEIRPARYAGSAACRQCHPNEHRHWRETGMAKMLQPVGTAKVLGDFTGGAIADEQGRTLARFSSGSERPSIEVSGRRFAVEFTIGSKWQQAYATRAEDGRIHVFPYQYNALHKTWVNYWKRIDPPTSARTDPATFLKLGPATDYLRNCAPCHTSQLSAAGFREPGVNCEMCHGPAGDHVSNPKLTSDPAEPPVQFRKIGARQYMAICGQCHRQSAMFKRAGEAGLNFSGRSPAFWLATKQRPLIEFSRSAFYRDGRFRETTFIVEALERSKCYQKGAVTCGHCHDPHGGARSNEMSLKYPDQPNRMCVQCHANPDRHPKHPQQACVECHMPRIANSLLSKARTHFISDIPDEGMRQRFGAGQSPYVCEGCHKPDRPPLRSAEMK